jgi:hypothetical protein
VQNPAFEFHQLAETVEHHNVVEMLARRTRRAMSARICTNSASISRRAALRPAVSRKSHQYVGSSAKPGQHDELVEAG